MNGLLKNAEFAVVEPPAVAGTSTLTTDAVDMLNAENLAFLINIGTITSGAALSWKLQQSSDDAASDNYSDIEGSGITIADTQSDKLCISEIVKPLKRYVKGVLTRATQNAVCNGIVAVKTGLRNRPATQPASIMAASEVAAGPAEGTA